MVIDPRVATLYVGGRSLRTPSSDASAPNCPGGARYCASPPAARRRSTVTPSARSAAADGPSPSITASTCTAPPASKRSDRRAIAPASRADRRDSAAAVTGVSAAVSSADRR